MAVMGRIIGTIEVQSYEEGAYQQEHDTAMSLAANLTAVAIENVRLLRRESSAREAAEEIEPFEGRSSLLPSHTNCAHRSRLFLVGHDRWRPRNSEETMARQAIETIWRNAKAQSQIIDRYLSTSHELSPATLYLDLQPASSLVLSSKTRINVVRQNSRTPSGIRIEAELR